MISKLHIASALHENEWWPNVPDHRVLDRNSGFADGMRWDAHRFSAEERRMLLEKVGVRFSKDGRPLSATFSGFG